LRRLDSSKSIDFGYFLINFSSDSAFAARYDKSMAGSKSIQ